MFKIFHQITPCLRTGNLGFQVLTVLCLAVFSGISGCASLPKSTPVAPAVQREVMGKFTEFAAAQSECRSSYDAEVSVSLDSLLLSGTMEGYLQLMPPGFFKFVGVNFLGQPTVILASNGRSFQYVPVSEWKYYEGPVRAAAFTDYAPEGFDPEFGFYWFIGRLKPGQVRILSVEQDREGSAYWIDTDSRPDENMSRILFDPQAGVLRRHIVHDGSGEMLMDVRYDEYQSGKCPLPMKITAESGRRNGRIIMKIIWPEKDFNFNEADFDVPLPRRFKRITIK